MAIQRGPFGANFTGKLGQTVGIKLGGGKYGVYAYQPTVINPKTVKQNTQRAKFTFVQQFGGVFGNLALQGLEGMRFKKVRNAFNSVNVENLIVDNPGTNPKVNLMLSAPKLKLSHGYEPTPILDIADQGTPAIKVTGTTIYNPSGVHPDALRIVIFVPEASQYNGYTAQVVDLTYTQFNAGEATTGISTINLDLMGQQPQGATLDVLVYSYNIRYEAKGGVFRSMVPVGDVDDLSFAFYGSGGVDLIGGRKYYSDTHYQFHSITL